VVERFHSKPLELPKPGHRFERADLVFYDTDHSGPTFEARIFIGAKPGLKSDAGVDHPAYAGSYHVFGHGGCYGEAGHCDIPVERDPFDYRPRHHLEPGVQVVTVTEAIERLVANGKEKAAVDVFALDPDGSPLKALSFSRLRLLTYA